jgi:predicted adenylyl cyclase CyaB
MQLKNIEIKARCAQPARVEEYLVAHSAYFKGLDHQRDTYFNVQRGRMKLREGIIENALIHYDRVEGPGLKKSEILLYKVVGDTATLRDILMRAFGVLKVVEKERSIYYIDHIKFHIDHIVGLGDFVEIEVIDETGTMNEDTLRSQCMHYMKELGIADKDLVAHSYSDML